jgi:hypothetical protein
MEHAVETVNRVVGQTIPTEQPYLIADHGGIGKPKRLRRQQGRQKHQYYYEQTTLHWMDCISTN